MATILFAWWFMVQPFTIMNVKQPIQAFGPYPSKQACELALKDTTKLPFNSCSMGCDTDTISYYIFKVGCVQDHK